MSPEIHTISTLNTFRFSVNCYAVKTEGGFVLIDTGESSKRAVIDGELRRLGCQPGDLKHIVLTHGDFDHCGNAAHLRQTHGAPIAMHEADLGMVERGEMFWNRKQPNPLARAVIGLMSRLDEADRFTPDRYLTEGDRLSVNGFNADVIEIPGHSRGSIGLLTADGDLFCGDLLGNVRRPGLWTIMDDREAAAVSLDKLGQRPIRTVYPGHGDPFPMARLAEA